MPLLKNNINQILLVSLSNIGDVIMTFPVIDILKDQFPQAKLSVVVGPKAYGLLKGNKHLDRVFIFNKQDHFLNKFKWIKDLRSTPFDLVIDLRYSAIPWLVHSKYRTSLRNREFPLNQHRRLKHLERLREIIPFSQESSRIFALPMDADDQAQVERWLASVQLTSNRFAMVAVGAANHLKRWSKNGFAQIANWVQEKKDIHVVWVGDSNDQNIVKEIANLLRVPGYDACGVFNFRQLAILFKKATFFLGNDSGLSHLASYLDVPSVVVFGPTDPIKYGPWSTNHVVVRENVFCSPCEKSGCAYQHECMNLLQPSTVISAIERLGVL